MTAAVFRLSLSVRIVASPHFERRERKSLKTLDSSNGTGLGNGREVRQGTGLRNGSKLLGSHDNAISPL